MKLFKRIRISLYKFLFVGDNRAIEKQMHKELIKYKKSLSLLLIWILFLVSCNSKVSHQSFATSHNIEITFNNGDKDTLKNITTIDTLFCLELGDLQSVYYSPESLIKFPSHVEASNVRTFSVLTSQITQPIIIDN